MRLLATVLLVLIGSAAVGQEKVDPTVPTKTKIREPQDIPIPTEIKGARIIELDLQDALRMADRGNADLDVFRLGPDRSRFDVIIAKAFYDSEIYANAGINRQQNPSITTFDVNRDIYDAEAGWRTRMLSGALFDISVSSIRTSQGARSVGGSLFSASKTYDSSLNLSLTQPLLRGAWWEYGEADIRRSEAAAAGADDAYEQSRQDVLLEVVRAYWDLVFARADYRVRVQALDLAREQLRITLARIEVKDLAPRDKIADETEVARQEEARIVAEAAIRRAEDRLRALLFRERENQMWQWVLRPTTELVPDLSQVDELQWSRVAELAMRQRPQLNRLRRNITIAEQNLVLADGDLWPQLDLVGAYNSGGRRIDNLENTWGDIFAIEYPDWSLRLNFTYPIGNRAAQARRDRAALDLEEATRRLFAEEIRVRREVRDAVRDTKTLAASIQASRKTVESSETDLDTARHKQRVGTLTPFDVHQRNQELQEARSRLHRNYADFRISEAVLKHVQGRLRPPAEEQKSSGDGR